MSIVVGEGRETERRVMLSLKLAFMLPLAPPGAWVMDLLSELEVERRVFYGLVRVLKANGLRVENSRAFDGKSCYWLAEPPVKLLKQLRLA